ncbi:MAG: diguanylate cyclase domain-containing protein [Aminipila sp.]
MKIFDMKIKNKLPIFAIVLSVVPILVLSGIVMLINSEVSLKNYKMIISNQAEASSKHVSSFYSTQKNGLIYSSNILIYKEYLTAIDDNNYEYKNLLKDITELQNVAKTTDESINDIFLADLNGNIIACSDKSKIGSSILNSSAYSKAKYNRDIAFQIMLDNGKKELLMAYPIIDNGNQVIGVILREINTDAINRYIKELEIGSTGYLYVLDENGKLLLHRNNEVFKTLESTEKQDKSLSKFLKSVKDHTLKDDRGFLKYKYQGKNILAYYQKNYDTNWVIVAAIPESEINQSSLFTNYIILTVALITGIISLYLGLLFVRTITRPLNKLTENINMVADGKMDQTFNYDRSDEFAQVYDAVNVMSHRLNVTYNKLSESAKTDVLTGISNRKAIYEIMDSKFDNNIKQSAILLDLDGFKAVNDKYGHDFGDDVLISVANVLNSIKVDGIYVARLGGDEFIVFLEYYKDDNQVKEFGEFLCKEIAAIKTARGKPITISASIGIAFSDKNDISRDKLIKKADLAMYEVKKNGKSGYLVYDSKRGFSKTVHP